MITTKRGDGGETDCGGKRVSKGSLLVETIGEIDELQAVLYLVGSQISDFRSQLEKIIKDLGVIMGELGSSNLDLRSQISDVRKIEKIKIYDLRIKQFENKIEKSDKNLSKFIFFKTKKAKELNWARTVCRRVERRMVSLSKNQKIDKEILRYFNRLSDYLFILALKSN